MARNSPPPVNGRNLLWVLSTAASGQFFLSRSQADWTLWAGLVFIALAFWKIAALPEPSFDPPKSQGWEMPLLALTLLLGTLTLFWRLHSFPPGLHDDQGEVGYCALRILKEGWRPFTEVFDYPTPFPLEFYQLAGWFGLWGASEWTLHLYFICLTLAAFPLFYWLVRRWTGPSMALLSLFFLAAMRWQWAETRSAHFCVEVPFYLLGLILLFHLGVRKKSPVLFVLSAAWAGLGFYGYGSLKALPLLWLALAAYEWLHAPTLREFFRRNALFAALVFLMVASPYLSFCWNHGTFGNRESETWVFSEVRNQGNLLPLFHSITGTLLILNRQASDFPLHNIPGHRPLDDIMGPLFLVGLALGWRRRERPEAAYPLIAFGAMALPSLLTTDPGSPQRLTGWIPWIAYFAAWAAMGLWDWAKAAWRSQKGLRIAAAGLLLMGVGAQNAYTYFGIQAKDPRCQAAFEPEQSFIGREIREKEKGTPGHFHYWIDPLYAHSPTVFFLAYPARDRIAPFSASDWVQSGEGWRGDSLFFLTGDKTGTVDFLQALYPQSQTQALTDGGGRTEVYFINVPGTLFPTVLWNRGLVGVYQPLSGGSQPVLRRDPVLDFSSRFDFPFIGDSPLNVQWRGTLRIPRAGDYEFQTLDNGQAKLWLDKREIPFEKPVQLPPGRHRLELEYVKGPGYFNAFHLIWKKPGDEKWEVVPAGNFGILPTVSKPPNKISRSKIHDSRTVDF